MCVSKLHTANHLGELS